MATAPTESTRAALAPLLAVPEAPRIAMGRDPLPPRQRPGAGLSILDITKYFGETSGGVRTYLLEKARYVSARPSLRQILVLPGARDAITEIDGARTYWLHGPSIPFQKPYRFLLAPRSLHRIVEHERPDLIEVGSPFVVPWITRRANRKLRAPMVWFYHGNVPRVVAPRPQDASGVRRRVAELSWRYVRRVSRMFRAVFACSEFTARDLESSGVEHVMRVPLGVDLDLFHPARRTGRAETRRRAGWPDGPVVIHVGRLAGEKELEVALRAWPEIERRTGATLVVVGNGPSEAPLRRLARGRIVWRPFEQDREALADLIAAADLYLAPCPIETFGLAALEALASGVPVLSAGQGGVAEKVLASGAGALYPAGDVAGCAEAAVSLLSKDLGGLGRQGREFAERHHAWPIVLDAIFQAYHTVLGA